MPKGESAMSRILAKFVLALSLVGAALPAVAQTPSTAPVLEPKAQALVDTLAKQGGKPLYTLSYEDARKVLEDAQSGPVVKAEADVQDTTFSVGPTGEIPIRIYRPKGVKGLLPVAVYIHGGGWVLGSKATHDRLLRDLVRDTAAAGTPTAFVFVVYTPSPEAQFPVSIEQAYAATKYVAEHGKPLNVDSSRMAVIGDSVGGNMTAAVTLLANQRGGPGLRYQVLLYPVTDASMSTESYAKFANGPWLTKPAMAWFWDAYAPKAEDREKILASPIRATKDELKGLPPALVVVDENDVLRDEGEAYARNLIGAGVGVTAVRYLATIHDFAMLNALADSEATKSAIRLAAGKLAEALHK
jgi:acetyl esterase